MQIMDWWETKKSDFRGFKINFKNIFSGKFTSQRTNSRFAKTKNLNETPKFTFTETLTITWMSNIKDVPAKKKVLHHRVSHWHTWTYSHTVTKTKFSCTDKLPYFLTNGTLCI